MYRVIAVDDEELVLESFAHVISKYGGSFELAGTFLSGEEALASLSALRPDLVFMDVNMPGLDGIEVIRRMKDLFPEIVFILATAYERFDIARKVIPLNVFSYMVKPITRPKILGELDRVALHLETRKRESPGGDGRRHRISAGADRQNSLRKWLMELLAAGGSEDNWNEVAVDLGFSSDRAACALLAPPTGGNPLKWAERVSRQLEYKLKCFPLSVAGRIFVLADSGEQRAPGELKRLLHDICGDAGSCVLDEYGSISALPDRYRDLLRRMADLMGTPLLSESAIIAAAVRNILESPQNRQAEEFRAFWTGQFSTRPFEEARGMMISFFTLYLHEGGASAAMLPGSEVAPVAEITPLTDLDEWEAWAVSSFPRIQGILEASRGTGLPSSLEAALEYIHSNYNNPLQLVDVAEECKVSISHLSRLFSRYMNMGFVDYLNRYRIDTAEKLIRQKAYSIKEVAFQVGFQDPNYFSRIFKRYRGFVPSEL